MERCHDFTNPDEWWAEYISEYDGRDWLLYRPLVAQFIRHGQQHPLLDIGSGLGFLIECARRFGVHAIGVEASDVALAECRARHPHVEVRKWVGGDDLPFENCSVGGAILNEFVDHITTLQNDQLFKELFRVLMPEGIIIVKSPSRHNFLDNDLGHVTFFSRNEFKEFIINHGFELIENPYVPLPIFGSSRAGRSLARAVSIFFKPDRFAARIDLVARKKKSL